MRLIFGEDERIAKWVGERIGIAMCPPYVAIGGTRYGTDIDIGVVFNNWNGANMDISLASKYALTRGAIRSVYRYAFVQAGAKRLTAITKPSNDLMLKQLPRFGFIFEGPSARYFGDEDGLRFALFPENAKKWMA